MSKTIFPAIKLQMGSWEYYSVRMTLGQVKDNLVLATSFEEPTVLDDFLQRKHQEGRSFGAMTTFLQQRDDRFYASLVVAPIGSSPIWTTMDPPEEFRKKHKLDTGDEVLGYVELDKDTKYYVLDGQHRVGSINHVIEHDILGPDFKDEEINVLLVCNPDEDENEVKIKYRRLFTSLNRYAKPTDATTNIIMDEDDSIAILTRRLVENHPVFATPSGLKVKENKNVNIETKNLIAGVPYFTSLETLYKMNMELLKTPEFPNLNPVNKTELITRPSDEELDIWYEELSAIWDAISKTFKHIHGDRTKMRSHNSKDNEEVDIGYMWPLVQENLWAPVIRQLLTKGINEKTREESIEPLGKISWDLREAPWFPLILYRSNVEDPESSNIITAGDDKSKRIRIAKDIIYWIVGESILNDEDLLDLRANVQAYTTQLETQKERDDWWEKVLNLKL